MALIQFSADLNETRCKSCGRSARFFCAYFQRAAGKRELTPCDCRSRGFRWPCPPQRHWPLVRLPFARTRAAKWHFRCAVVGCHLPPPSPHPTCAVWWCVWRLLAPVTPEVPQIHLDSEIAWLVLALAQIRANESSESLLSGGTRFVIELQSELRKLLGDKKISGTSGGVHLD